jgi:hypothetical protein
MLSANIKDRQKYQRLKNNLMIAQNREKYMHCGDPECDGMVSTKLTNQQIQSLAYNSHNPNFSTSILPCLTCRKTSCKICGALAFINHKDPHICDEMEDALDAMYKNAKGGGQVGRCPRCRAVFEKDGGCPVMTCTVCQYTYCWVCGMQSEHWLHVAMGGELTCGLIMAMKSLGSCASFWLQLLFFIFLPLIVLIASLCGAFYAAGGCTYVCL